MTVAVARKRKTYTIEVWGWDIAREDDKEPADHYGKYMVRAVSRDAAYDLAAKRAEEEFGGTFEEMEQEEVV